MNALLERIWARLQGRTRKALLTTLANGLAAVAKVLASIVVVSVLIGYLGAEDYGLVVTVTGMMAWLLMLDAGFGLSMKNELIEEVAGSDRSARKAELFTTAWLSVLALVGTCFLILVVVVPRLPWRSILNASSQAELWMGSLVLTVAGLTLLGLPLQLVNAYYAAHQREYLFAPWKLLSAVLGVVLAVSAVSADLGVVAAGAAVAAGNALSLSGALVWFKARFGMLRLGAFRRELVGRLLRVGSGFFVIRLSMVFIFQIDIFVANYVVGHAGAAEYQLHLQLLLYADVAITLLVSPFWSPLGEAMHQGDLTWFLGTIRRLLLISAALILGYSALLLLIGDAVMPTWSRGEIEFNMSLAASLVAYIFIRVVVSVPSVALGALGIVRGPAVLAVFHAIFNLTLSVWWAHLWGLVGIALASVASYILTSVWYIPLALRTAVHEAMKPPQEEAS